MTYVGVWDFFFKQEQAILTCVRVGVFVTFFHSIDYTKALTIPFKNKSSKLLNVYKYVLCAIFFFGVLTRAFVMVKSGTPHRHFEKRRKIARKGGTF